MNIGEIAKKTGLSAKMIRHYEELGLLPGVPRRENGYRQYRHQDIQTLLFIKRTRNLGFSFEKVGQLLELWHNKDRASADVKRIVMEQISIMEEKVIGFQEIILILKHLSDHCRGDERPDCPIIEGIIQGLK